MNKASYQFKLLLLPRLLFINSCDSLEQTLRKSENQVVNHGPDLYYKRVMVGNYYKDNSENKKLENLLIQKRLWINRRGFHWVTESKYDIKKKKYINVSVYTVIYTSIKGTYKVYNTDCDNVVAFFCIAVPYGNEDGWKSLYFIYNK